MFLEQKIDVFEGNHRSFGRLALGSSSMHYRYDALGRHVCSGVALRAYIVSARKSLLQFCTLGGYPYIYIVGHWVCGYI